MPKSKLADVISAKKRDAPPIEVDTEESVGVEC